MLILQRKEGQSVLIGDGITVSVVSVDGGRVRLAIDAPAHVAILRSELVTATAANQDAAHEEANPNELLNLFGNALETNHNHVHLPLLKQRNYRTTHFNPMQPESEHSDAN